MTFYEFINNNAQFVPDDFLKDKIKNTADFNTVHAILDKYVFEVTDKETIWKKLKEFGFLDE